MKKIYYIILITIISIFIMSCGSHFNPKYYYNRGSGSSTTNPEGPDIGGGGEGLSPEDDPFYDNGERPWNKPDYNFNMNFDDYVIQASFDENNRPSYKLVPGKWNSGDESKNEYWYDGPSTTGGGTTINNMKYYLYKGHNHLFAADSGYNKSDRLKRFYFYRFEGSAFNVSIRNCLIAIDTYSKLVFAFGVPSLWKRPVNIMGVPYAPAGWQAVENGWEAKYEVNTEDHFDNVDGIKYFYEYDPVGVVKANGEIEIFQWCLDSIGNSSKYAPRVKGNIIDLKRNIASETEKEGRSPYMPIKVVETIKDNITIMAKSFKNISGRSAEGYLKWFEPKYDDIRDYGYFTYTISGSVYNSEISTGDLIDIEHLDPRDDSITGMIYVNEVKKIDKNNDISFTSSKSFEIKNINENVYIDLASRIFKYNTLAVAGITRIDTANFGKGGSGEVASKDMPKLKLKYDASNQQFVVDTQKSIMRNDALSTTISYYTPNFTLKKGETKNITIRYKWMRGNDTVNGEEFEVTYTLKFESAK